MVLSASLGIPAGLSIDRAKARKEGRCLACGQKDHFRPECPNVAPENRVVQDSAVSPEASPKAGQPGGKGGRAKVKAKASPQAKGITEDGSGGSEAARSVSSSASPGSSGSSQDALLAEAAKLLKNVTLKPVRIEGDEYPLVSELGIDSSWLLSAITSASDVGYALIDSGATNALRPAAAGELEQGKTIKVDLASGAATLRINDFGTLLHSGPCQVIIPAGYFIELGYTIAWKRKGCRVKHPQRGSLAVSVVKGCPLIPREVGLEVLAEYEARQSKRFSVKSLSSLEPVCDLNPGEVRRWVRDRLLERNGEGLKEADQLTCLVGLFPEIPREVLLRVCVPALDGPFGDHRELPWNRRKRRTLQRAKLRSSLLHIDGCRVGWKGCGGVVSVDGSGKGLASKVVFQQLLRWAESGVFGGVVLGSGCNQGQASDEGLVVRFRALLLFVVAQAASDASEPILEGFSKASRDDRSGSVGVDDPYQLALWALRESAARIASPVVDKVEGEPIFFLCDRPISIEGKLEIGEQAWKGFKKGYSLEEATFDQACLGGSSLGSTRVDHFFLVSL